MIERISFGNRWTTYRKEGDGKLIVKPSTIVDSPF
jgi:hypothetical protein